MPYIPRPAPTLSSMILFRILATAWLRHFRCRVRRCRRNCRCMGEVFHRSVPQCLRDMPAVETDAMLAFFRESIKLATPERFAEHLARATTDEEREMIDFQRRVFLSYHDEMARAGLKKPLGPPFVEG